MVRSVRNIGDAVWVDGRVYIGGMSTSEEGREQAFLCL